MSTWSAVNIGEYSLGGQPKQVDYRYTGLFNATDLIATGNIADQNFLRTYRISVAELRRRLEAIGYTVARVREDVVTTLKRAYPELSENDFPESRKFLDYGCAITSGELIQLAREWKSDHNKPMDFSQPFKLRDFPGAMRDFLQGDIPEGLIPNESVWLSGHHFERLLCEAFEDDDVFEIDFTDLIRAGYYKENAQPIGNEYDEMLASFKPLFLRLGSTLHEEESETLEFKTVSGGNVPKAVASSIADYVIGFLNNKGGRMLYGVTDAGVVEGVRLNRAERDEIRRRIGAACIEITPRISLNTLDIQLRPLISVGRELEDVSVVEITVPPGKADEMYFKATSGSTYIRVGTETRALKGHELFVHICTRYGSPADSAGSTLQRLREMIDDISRVKQDGERYEGELLRKEAEMAELKRTLSGAWKLLKETDLICPHCESTIAIREFGSDIYESSEGKDASSDFEYIEYECGYSMRSDRGPLSACSASQS